VVSRLQKIFSKADLEENFSFEKVSTPQELQGRLIVGDYDILINTVDMGIKQDMSKLFSTDNPQDNPSQYQNQKLTSLLGQYAVSNKSKSMLNDINNIYSKDMPVVIL
jgi:hypothetical protein